MTEMGGTTPKRKPKTVKVQEDETVELLNSLQKSPEDLDVFMNQALQEALKEAKSKTPNELADMNPLDDEEMMEEIKQVFEKANDELLASLEDIRKEQVRTSLLLSWLDTMCVLILSHRSNIHENRRKWQKQVLNLMHNLESKPRQRMKNDCK
jgi:hypothetical protein